MLKVTPLALSAIAVSLGLATAGGPAIHAQAPNPTEAAQTVVEGTCQRCHNDRMRYGGMSLEGFEVATASEDPVLAEKMVRKLRAGMMPPAGVSRPDEAALTGLAIALETRLDARAAVAPNPGRRSFQRLNRAEYERSIRDLLALDVHAGNYLPLDTKSANFDNIADVQLLSPTLMNGYLRAAAEVSRLAVGDPTASPIETTYKVTRWVSQREQVDGAPYGSRGGVSVVHTFPADAEYVFRVSFHHETTGDLFGSGRGALHTVNSPEQIEILGRWRARGVARHRSLDARLGPRRRQSLDRPDPDHCRTASRVGRFRTSVRRTGPGPDLAPRMVALEHQASPMRTASRVCRICVTSPSAARSTPPVSLTPRAARASSAAGRQRRPTRAPARARSSGGWAAPPPGDR